MSIKSKLSILLTIASPILGGIMEEKVIPNAVKIAYNVLDNFIDSRIEALVDLFEKASKTKDPEKRERHLKGLRLGLDFLSALSKKMSEACEVLTEELKGIENGLQG